VRVFVQVHAGRERELRNSIAKIEFGGYTLIVARVFLASFFATFALVAQTPPAQQPPPAEKKLKTPQPKPDEEPPEEDETLVPKEYALNPLESARNVITGNFYFKKGNYRAAAKRYLEATRWDPNSADAFLRLAESEEKLKDRAAAREAYSKYLALAPDSKIADQIKKKIAKWPEKP
jgi:tetratricopeptide (TPR) repeat protein